MPKDFTKDEKKLLRKLRSLAYKRKLEENLDKLGQDFTRWRNENIDSYELEEKILEFQNGTNSEFSNKYDSSNESLVVAAAIVNGILDGEEVDDKLLNKLEDGIDAYKKITGKSEG